MALMARAYNQAQKFGVEMAIPDEVMGLDRLDDAAKQDFVLKLSDNEHATARSIVIATGARYPWAKGHANKVLAVRARHW